MASVHDVDHEAVREMLRQNLFDSMRADSGFSDLSDEEIWACVTTISREAVAAGQRARRAREEREFPAILGKGCPSCGLPTEVPGEGRFCGSCQDYEGHCANDHCMACGGDT